MELNFGGSETPGDLTGELTVLLSEYFMFVQIRAFQVSYGLCVPSAD